MVALARSLPVPHPADSEFADDVLAGLRASPKRIPAKYFYDAEGSLLFEKITELPEYYPTLTELKLRRDHGRDIARLIPEGAALVEFGSGSSKKARLVLKAAPTLAAYVPVDICAEMIENEAADLRRDRPQLPVLPVVADICKPFMLPEAARNAAVRVGFFPGSTIGNFEPDQARCFLTKMRAHAGSNAMLLLGADGNANKEELLRAYDDREGVTAAFDLNVLSHVNATHRADFDLERFMHRAVWNAARSRIEMHLVSKQKQVVHVGAETIKFERGEPIVTEHCYKHSPAMLAAIMRDAGWELEETYVDAQQRMRMYLARGR